MTQFCIQIAKLFYVHLIISLIHLCAGIRCFFRSIRLLMMIIFEFYLQRAQYRQIKALSTKKFLTDELLENLFHVCDLDLFVVAVLFNLFLREFRDIIYMHRLMKIYRRKRKMRQNYQSLIFSIRAFCR
jgi:predicted Zn-dependent protease